MKNKVIRYLLLIVLAIVVVSIVFQTMFRTAEETAFTKGKQIAVENGCFHCHGPAGLEGIPNPNSKEENVPSWQGGSAMMYIFDDDDIEEWVMDGHLKEKVGDTAALIRMPAFRNILSKEEFTNLQLYLEAIMEIIPIEDTVAERGYEIASKVGCFGCHGPYGLGGGNNPNAFKSYIPGWEGDDYALLVENEDELEEWIKEGKIERIEQNAIAQFFTKDQVIKMPAYKNILSKDETNSIITYIQWLRKQDFN